MPIQGIRLCTVVTESAKISYPFGVLSFVQRKGNSRVHAAYADVPLELEVTEYYTKD